MSENYITEVDILDEAKDCFLTYASEVLTDRAIPAAEDGLLSSQRKILWTMEDVLKMNNKSKTKKCNALVGSTLSTAYFHGDASCYGVLCKMSQEYLMRYPLIQGQGALGTQEDNSLVASSRYTEAKPSIFADLMMADYKKNPVPTKETYNGEYQEPVVLPALFPNALCNGRQAIGISMAHSSAPHNLTEVIEGIIAYIQNPEIDIKGLMEYIKGPDFPLGGTIINKKDIYQAFATGKSATSLKVRGDYVVEGNTITFTTIPYRTYRNKIKEQLEKNVDEFEKVLVDFTDKSNLGQNRLVFEAKPGCVNTLLNLLFKLTDLQTTISYNMNFIVNGTPKLCSIKDLIVAYVAHQQQVMINVAQSDLEKAQFRKHIIEGLLIAINDIDKAIELIRSSNNRADASEKLIKHFNLTSEQAGGILDMKLVKLTKLDKDDLLNELQSLIKAIEEYDKIIHDETYRKGSLIIKLNNLKTKYGDARRTQITQIEAPAKEDKEIEYVEPEKCVVVLTEGGAIKRIPANSFKTQKRNGKGIKTQDDITNAIIRTNTIDNLMIFTNRGKMYRLLVDNIPSGTNASKGVSIKSLVELEPGEEPTLIYSIYRDTNAKFVIFATKRGIIKKTPLDEYIQTKKKTGMAAIKLREGDELAAVSLTSEEDIILISRKGQMLRFKNSEVSASSRATIGMKGIGLADDDEVIAMLPIRDTNDYLAVFGVTGQGKRIELSEIPLGSRGTKGLKCYKDIDVAAACLVAEDDHVLIVGLTNSICVGANEIPIMSRVAMGNGLIKNRIKTVSKV